MRGTPLQVKEDSLQKRHWQKGSGFLRLVNRTGSSQDEQCHGSQHVQNSSPVSTHAQVRPKSPKRKWISQLAGALRPVIHQGLYQGWRTNFIPSLSYPARNKALIATIFLWQHVNNRAYKILHISVGAFFSFLFSFFFFSKVLDIKAARRCSRCPDSLSDTFVRQTLTSSSDSVSCLSSGLEP